MSEDEDYLASIGGAGATGTQEPSPESPRQETVTKEQVGRYERQAELGRGGIGRVWLGYDTHIGREVAIKELLDSASASLSEQSGGSSIYTARFLREARVTGRLEHPAIIPVYELGERDDGSLYYTMKYVRGRTLADSLAECHDLESRLSLLQHVANLSNAIAFAHGHRVLHRDIKPANVMVGSYGETVVLDWGLAKVLDDDPELTRGERRLKSPTEAAATLDGHALGTPAYMSPEQAEGRIEEVDQRSDVWGLGAVLYELLAGVPPYDGKTPYEIVGKVITADPSPIIEHEPAAPRELVAVAEKALSRKPNDRYDDASAFAAELESFRSGRRVEAHRYSTVELLQRVWNRHRSAVLVAAVALLAAVVLATVSYRRVSSERDRALEAESVARVRLGRALYEKAQVALERRDWLAAEALTAASLSYDDTPTARGLLLAPDRRWEPNLVWIRS
ncbi:MAG: serine/threonine-protein kinase [Myxococcota bacterium]